MASAVMSAIPETTSSQVVADTVRVNFCPS
jgi:hypothetical protein